MNKTILLLVIIVLGAQAETQWRNHATFFDGEIFDDLQGWSQESFGGTGISECAGQSLAGGHGVAGKGAVLKKSIEGIPTHYKLRVTVEVHFMDSWDKEEFIIKVNGETMSKTESNWRQHKNHSCGNGDWKDRNENVEIEFSHISGNVDIEFSSTLNQDANDESWAVRNVIIDYKYCDDCELLSNEFEGDFSEEDIVGWNSNREIDYQWVSSCEGSKFIGGYGKFSKKFQISKTFSNLPPHTSVVVSFLLWQIDSWDARDSWRAVVDNKEGFNGMKVPGAHEGNKDCGGTESYKDQLVVVSFEVPHFTDDLEILFEDDLNQGAYDESWGISKLKIELVTCKDNCQEIVTENNWKLEDGSDFTETTECQGVTIFGGYKTFGSSQQVTKTYDNLPEHTHLQFSIEAYFIDDWVMYGLFFSVDNVPSFSTPSYRTQAWPINDISCGGKDKDDVQLITFEIPHIKSSATVLIQNGLWSTTPTSKASLGWREDHLYVITREDLIEYDSDLTDGEFTEHSFETPQNSGNVITNCGGESILGGYEIFGKYDTVRKEYSGLPAHTGILITFKTYFIDKFDNNERLWLKLKDDPQRKIVTQSYYDFPTQNLCGHYDKEYITYNENVSVSEYYWPHTADDLSFHWYSQGYVTEDINMSNESWGIRDYRLYLVVDIEDPEEEEEKECPILFSECHFKGIQQPLCDIDLDGETYSLEAVLEKFKNLALASGKNPSDFFQEIDMENMGQISNEEFVNVLLNLGLTNQDVQLVMQYVDLENSNDLVNWKDFLKKLRKYTINVRSIYVPEGQSVTLYEENNWGGELVVFETSQECLIDVPIFTPMSQPSMDLMEVNHKTAKGSKQHHLRKQN